MANLTVSAPGAALALRIACRSEPAPESFVLVTVKVAAAWAGPVAARSTRPATASAARSSATIARMPAALSFFVRSIFATLSRG